MEIRTQVVLPLSTNLPEDIVTNTYYWQTGDTNPAAERTEIANRIVAAYNAMGPNYSADVSRAANACRIKYYDLSQPEPRLPILESGFTLVASGQPTVGSPQEIAAVLSFRSSQVPGFPLARRRGRVYLGPWAPTLLASSYVPTALVTGIRQFGERLLTPVDVLQEVTWCQYSSTTGLMLAVVTGHVDNAWDIQRRRGIRANARQTFGTPT